MITYEEVLSRLSENADGAYRDFHKKLLKNDAVSVIGVRMPVLRALSREWKNEADRLLTFPDEYYEVTFLKCAVIGLQPYEKFVGYVDKAVPLIDNWATCDCFTANCLKKHREEFLPFVKRYLADEREFVCRYGLVTLLHYYIDREYYPLIFDAVRAADGEKYYVMMAAAWLIAEVTVRDYDAGEAFLRQGCMPAQMHNKAIQKARESFRLTAEQKARLNALKRKA